MLVIFYFIFDTNSRQLAAHIEHKSEKRPIARKTPLLRHCIELGNTAADGFKVILARTDEGISEFASWVCAQHDAVVG